MYNREQVAQVHSRDVCLSQLSCSKQRVVAPREHLFYSSHSWPIQGSLGLGAFLVTPNSRTCQRDTLYGSCHGTEERNARITSLEKQLQVCIGFCLTFFFRTAKQSRLFFKAEVLGHFVMSGFCNFVHHWTGFVACFCNICWQNDFVLSWASYCFCITCLRDQN